MLRAKHGFHITNQVGSRGDTAYATQNKSSAKWAPRSAQSREKQQTLTDKGTEYDYRKRNVANSRAISCQAPEWRDPLTYCGCCRLNDSQHWIGSRWCSVRNPRRWQSVSCRSRLVGTDREHGQDARGNGSDTTIRQQRCRFCQIDAPASSGGNRYGENAAVVRQGSANAQTRPGNHHRPAIRN